MENDLDRNSTDFAYDDDDLWCDEKQEHLVEEAREAISSLSDEVLETVEGIRVMRAYSKKIIWRFILLKRLRIWQINGIRWPSIVPCTFLFIAS